MKDYGKIIWLNWKQAGKKGIPDKAMVMTTCYQWEFYYDGCP